MAGPSREYKEVKDTVIAILEGCVVGRGKSKGTLWAVLLTGEELGAVKMCCAMSQTGAE